MFNLKNSEQEAYLTQFGWSPSRKVTLPDYIDLNTTPKVVIAILENLYGLEFINVTGRERTFTVSDAYIRDFG